MRTLYLAATAAILATTFAAPAVSAEDKYPNKPVRMLVGFPPGGSADINARIMAQGLASQFSASIVPDNKPGAGGNIAATEAKRAAPDGYTIFYSTSAIVLAPSLYQNVQFDAFNDFVPISLTANIPLVLVTTPNLPVNNVKELVAHAKANPGKLNYASSGSGALLHLGGALFAKEMGIQATHVAYKGSAPAITDLIAGATQFMFLPLNEATPHIKAGKLKALALTSNKRTPILPDVPTIKEATGLDSLVMGAWQGILVPKGTPGAIVAQLRDATAHALQDKSVRAKLQDQGSEILGGTPQQYTDYMKSESVRWARVIKESGAKIE
ncbi:Tripartite-type tricarboxylate transporter, receptor component TctC [Cupriavidus sp. OV038]|jgi:tripartite-type tricarboxylate transporter receptor subunit TctC|uniref:Bug family tripartite tricarboxylate transporter substrate binding protein n=1 Tax=unclassified Cupriavidus TaxID=2640874 RepID=UPI0008DF9B87|nr:MULTISPECIES: tripartite tricarboxylate transporter substrate binding protein [unclassified Cupriavidus]SFC60124.1 Tripartite-type tricarboxylate transporter, receptor component TctC [Cupriavidus sp. OV038]SFP42855.1 Tripartite-type tricarboxylate transporter, receptor component TctC [Cupriavidus sp. OV096]